MKEIIFVITKEFNKHNTTPPRIITILLLHRIGKCSSKYLGVKKVTPGYEDHCLEFLSALIFPFILYIILSHEANRCQQIENYDI